MHNRAALILATVGTVAMLTPAWAASPSPWDTATDPELCEVAMPADSRILAFDVVDGSITWPDGWSAQMLPGDLASPSWGVVSPSGHVRLLVYAWLTDIVQFYDNIPSPPADLVTGTGWETILQVRPAGRTVVSLGDGVARDAQVVEMPAGPDRAPARGYLVTWELGDTSVAIIAMADRTCLPASDAVLRRLLAGVQPPTQRLAPVPTPVVITIGDPPSAAPIHQASARERRAGAGRT